MWIFFHRCFSASAAVTSVLRSCQATSARTARGLTCTSTEDVDSSGLALVVVRCAGSVPSLLAGLGNLLPLEVTGRAVKETA